MNKIYNSPNTYAFTDAKEIVVVGDIHGNFEKLVYKCCAQCDMTDTLIVVAGDCGFGFQQPGYFEDMYMKLSSRLAKANNWLVFVRGNHDNPAYFDGQQVNYKRWKAVPDYSVLKACGHTILCVGGAISADRKWRIRQEYEAEYFRRLHKNYRCPAPARYSLSPTLYWPNERPVYDQAQLEVISRDHAVDVVITHTAPSCCEEVNHPNIQYWLIRDVELLDDVKYERKVMDDIYTFLKEHCHPLQYWYYGHFHQSWHGEIEGVKYQLLDTMQLKKLAPDDDIFNQQSDKEYKEKLDELVKLAAKFFVF